MTESLAEQLNTGLQALGLSVAVSDVQRRQLLEFLSLIDKWNRHYNLTAIDSPQDRVTLHLLDSLSVQAYLRGQRFIDVGTGAGLPGIPLAIVMPEAHFTLLDASAKRTRFLLQVKASLGLDNVAVVHARVEDYRPETAFDGVISRAFSALPVMLESCQHLLTDTGRFYAMKGQYPEKELRQMAKGFMVEACQPLRIPGTDVERHLLIIASSTGRQAAEDKR